MFELWVPITIAAAFFQNLRSALQKHLKGKLSDAGAAYARFFYALPLALVYFTALVYSGREPPSTNTTFYIYCLLGSVCQIMFTVTLLWMFSFRSFAVGTTFSKLEIVMIAALGALFLGDTLSLMAVLAIALSTLGVLALSIGQTKLSWHTLLAGMGEKTTLIGLVCAAWLGGSVVFFRGAALALNGDDFLITAALALTIALLMQTVIMGAYLLLFEPGEFGRVLREWRWAGAVGISGVLGSIGWFSAFTLQNASYVRAVGQIELVFTFIATTLVFREQVSRAEWFGVALVVGGILLILLAA